MNQSMKRGILLETLTDYQRRTGFMWDSLPHAGGFHTSPGLNAKATPDGRLLPFYGDTVIFTLPPEMIRWLTSVQDDLYAACGDYLAQRLLPETFHITLHDLQNSPNGWPSGLPGNQKRARLLLQTARETLPPEVIVRSNCVFSMAGTSVVMGFEPAQDSDCRVLMSLYRAFQQIRPLSYPLTLHATLAYYRPGGYDQVECALLRDALDQLGRERREWRLRLSELHYAAFDSMNHYKVIG